MALVKKLKTLILGLAALLAFSCGGDIDWPKPAIKGCQLSQIDQLQEFGTRLEYNSAGKISKWMNTVQGNVYQFFTVDYNTSGLPIRTTHDNGFYETYEYDQAGLLIRKTFFGQRNQTDPIGLSYYYTFEYNSDKKVSKRSLFDAYQGIRLEAVENYFYPAANTARIEGYGMANNIASLAYIHEFTFDNHIGLELLTGALDAPLGHMSDNNILTQKSTYLPDSTVYNTEHIYQYNANGYPTIRRTLESGGFGGNNSATYFYSYHCH